MDQRGWSLENGLRLAIQSLRDHLPDVLSSKNAWDTTGAVYGPTGIPMPAHIGAEPFDDLAGEVIGAEVCVSAELTQFSNFDAQSNLLATGTYTCVVALTDAAAGTTDPTEYQNILTAYGDAIVHVLSTVFADSACREAGVESVQPSLVRTSPNVQVDGTSIWVRFLNVQATFVQRFCNSWRY